MPTLPPIPIDSPHLTPLNPTRWRLQYEPPIPLNPIHPADNMKPDMIAKLCLQCSDFYADTMQVMQRESVRNIWAKVHISPILLYNSFE